jgi:hypothetical protein
MSVSAVGFLAFSFYQTRKRENSFTSPLFISLIYLPRLLLLFFSRSTLAKEVQGGMKSTRLSLTELVAKMNQQYRDSTQTDSAQSAMQKLNDHHQLLRWLGQGISELEQTVADLERRTQ